MGTAPIVELDFLAVNGGDRFSEIVCLLLQFPDSLEISLFFIFIRLPKSIMFFG